MPFLALVLGELLMFCQISLLFMLFHHQDYEIQLLLGFCCLNLGEFAIIFI